MRRRTWPVSTARRAGPGSPRDGAGPMSLLALFGGLALLLYGMQLIGEGLQRAAGGHLRHLLTSMTRSRPAAVGSGALFTAIIQSSSATTLMLIGFVSAGLMTFRQSLGVILGADIGTTFTVQLLAFNIQEYSLLLVAVGFALTFFSRRGVAKNAGQAILGFGLIFLGMKVMTDGLSPLAANDLTRQVLVALTVNPFLGILAGALFSAGMSSSAATIGLTLSLGHQGLLTLEGAIAIVLGANIGTCATALAASLRSSSAVRGWMNGTTSATPSTLKPMCATATRRASEEERRLAASAVAQVPILAPRTIAIAPSSVSSP